eukprot:gene17826-biopygen8543
MTPHRGRCTLLSDRRPPPWGADRPTPLDEAQLRDRPARGAPQRAPRPPSSHTSSSPNGDSISAGADLRPAAAGRDAGFRGILQKQLLEQHSERASSKLPRHEWPPAPFPPKRRSRLPAGP